MNIVKSRGGMTALVAAMALASVSVFAQAPAGGPPGGGMRGPGGGGGFGQPADRPTTITREGLDDAALKLTAAQKTQIDKVVDDYLAGQKTLAEKYPRVQGAAPNPEATAARAKAREDFTAAVGKVLDASQKSTWEAARAARQAARPQGGPGMGGPGGPGMGGPGGPGGPPPAR